MKQYRPLFVAGGLILILVGLLLYRLQSAPDGVAAPRTVLAFSENHKSVKVGETFSVDVTSDPQGNSVVIVEPHLSYDPTVFQVMEITKLDAYPNVLSTEQIDAGKATITLGAVSISQPVVQKATVVRVVLKALKAANNAAISFDENSFVGSLADKTGPRNMVAARKNILVTVTE